MITYEEAKAFVIGEIAPLAPLTAALEDSWGCVAAELVTAIEAVPRFANSSMDGFALRARDATSAGARLRVVGASLAGDAPSRPLGPGEAARVMTGAPLPEGADCVCMIEETREDAELGVVEIGRPMTVGEYVRRPGDDIEVGDELVRPGEEMTAVRVAVLASQGRARLLVHPRARVGYLSTGNELVGPGEELRAGAIRDTNRPLLAALLRSAQCTPVDLGVVGDDYDATRERLLRGVAACDAVVSTGGVSMGDVDHVKSVILELGGDHARWMQVAIRPAKPFAFGTIGERATPVFGLPGNPVSTRVSFELFVRPALRRLGGHAIIDPPVFVAVADEPLGREPDGKLHLVHVSARVDPSGLVHVGHPARHGSHLLHAVAGANALALVPDGRGPQAGERVAVIALDFDRWGTGAS